MSISKAVLITVHDSTGKVIGTVTGKPKSAMWRATGKPPWVGVGRVRLKAYIVGSGKEAALHIRLLEGEPPPRRMVPSSI